MDPTTAALVAYLRSEADAAEERAKSLRKQAEAMARVGGMSKEEIEATDPANLKCDEEEEAEMAPLDEFGIPKYKGKKRGRKPKKRKRQRKPNAPKRQHTAYTLFVQENYPGIKEANSGLQSKDVISIVAKMWAEVDAAGKSEWKARAKATNLLSKQEGEAAAGGIDDDEGDDDENDGREDDEDGDEDLVHQPPPLDSHHHHRVPAEEVADAAAAAGAAAAINVTTLPGHQFGEEDTEDEEGTKNSSSEGSRRSKRNRRGGMASV